jgi:C4-dicarboxylate-specific signal transduction histidine kinase
VLAALGRFVVAPASRLIRRQVSELGAARDELERRVRERTAELERANARLEVEEAERRRAEERQRRLLEQLGRAARADAVGAMASGLAHELNQPLGAIANYAEGCLVALDAPEPPLDEIRGAVERVLAASIRAGRIIQRIRAFVTRREPAFEIVEPGRVAREVVEFCGEQARRRGVRLDLAVAPDLPSVHADPVQIQLVLVNLVTNGLDALDAAELEQPHIVLEVIPGPDGEVEYRVIDNGEGIEPTQRDRIFDTFFSTRADGMGMGLAISRTIVEAHGGRIAAESEPGVGTTFRFRLPAAPDHDESADGLPGGR